MVSQLDVVKHLDDYRIELIGTAAR